MRRIPKDFADRYLIAAIPPDASLMPVFWVAGGAWNSDPMQAALFRDEQTAKLEIVCGQDRGRFNADALPYSLKFALSRNA